MRVILADSDDMKSERVELKEGMHVIIWDGDIEAEGVLEFEDEMLRADIVPGAAGTCMVMQRSARGLEEYYWQFGR